ncbi:MAG TPA: hypothetical protein VN952_04750 [Chthoniobacterales bacterium]|nr:hypothetical protein [Chthoniobacterales bacterium]
MITLRFVGKNGIPCRKFVLAVSTLFVVGVLHAQTPEPVTYLTFDEGTAPMLLIRLAITRLRCSAEQGGRLVSLVRTP